MTDRLRAGDAAPHRSGAVARLEGAASRLASRGPARVRAGNVRPSVPGAFLEAHPNPVPPGNFLGTARVEWSTGDGSPGFLYYGPPWQREVPYGAGPEGSADIGWIANDFAYRFRLYGDAERRRPIAEVTVRRGRPKRAFLLDLAFACVAVSAAVSPILGVAALAAAGVRWVRRPAGRGGAGRARG